MTIYAVPYKESPQSQERKIRIEANSKEEALRKADAMIRDEKARAQTKEDIYQAGKTPLQEAIGETAYGVLETGAAVATSLPGMVGQAIGEYYDENGQVRPGWVDWVDGYNPDGRVAQQWLSDFGDTELAKWMQGLPPTMGGGYANSLRKQGLKNTRKKNLKPVDTDTLRAQAKKLYKESKDIGAVIKNDNVRNFSAQLQKELKNLGFDKDVAQYGKVKAVINELNRLSKGRGGVGLEDLERVRRMAGNAVRDVDDTTRAMGLEIIHSIDSYAEGVGSNVLKSGSKIAVAKLKLARDAYKKFSKTEFIADLKDWAHTRAGFQQTGQSPLELMRKDIGMMFSPTRRQKQLGFFSNLEQEALKDFAMGGKLDKALQRIGVFGRPTVGATFGAGTGGGIGAMIGGMFGEPFIGGTLGAGLSVGSGVTARGLLNKRLANKADDLELSLSHGGPEQLLDWSHSTLNSTDILPALKAEQISLLDVYDDAKEDLEGQFGLISEIPWLDADIPN